MSDIVISTKSEEKPVVQDSDIKDTLKAADEYKKLKEENDRLEEQYIRQQELKAKIAMGGKANAGMPNLEKTQEEKDREEAIKLLSIFK